MKLHVLSDWHENATTERAQRFLTGAFDAVNGVLENLDMVRDIRKKTTGDVRGRLPNNEADLLRAAIVFAGAGLDASLKQLIRDALPSLLDTNEIAHREFETFVKRTIATVDGTNPTAVARYLIAPDARSQLIEDYIYKLTGSSLQSSGEVLRTAQALGLSLSGTEKDRIKDLKDMFHARNAISHELDLQSPEKQGDSARRSRKMKTTVDMCSSTLETAQQLINAVGESLTVSQLDGQLDDT